jgi:hypothetical protein
MTKVVELRAWRRRNVPSASHICAEDIRRAGTAAHRLAREQRLRSLCDSVVDALVESEHPLASDPAALLELLEILEKLRTEARFQADHPVRG